MDWSPTLPGGRIVDLPTYAFQRHHYWLTSAYRHFEGPAACGLGSAGHGLLGATVSIANSDGTLLTGRLSLATHPWLADHVVRGTVLLPGTGFVELAMRAGEEVGCHVVDELVIELPLMLRPDEPVQIQVSVEEADHSGRHPVSIHSRRENTDAGWTTHATGVLAPERATTPFALTSWPPSEEQVDVSDAYDRLAAAGLEFGPAFQGLRAAWERDGEFFAEVALPEPQHGEATRFGIHPALLDAALHTVALHDAREGIDRSNRLPFEWRGVRLWASGATALRVRLMRHSADSLSLQLADSTGAPVASVDSLVLRVGLPTPVTSREPLFAVDWREVDTAGCVEPRIGVVTEYAEQVEAILGDRAFGLVDLDNPGDDLPNIVLSAPASPGADPVAAAYAATEQTLALVQRWLADSRFDGSRLVVVTQGAVHGPVDLGSAPVWGLVRSVQIEQPGRFVLVDLDDRQESQRRIRAALAVAVVRDEDQLALHDGVVSVPRLGRLIPEDGAAPPLNVQGTVVLTGGLGMLGKLVARWLVAEHGVRHLVLTGRRGPETPGAAEFIAKLATAGATASAVRCDVTDRDAIAALLAAIPAEHPLTAVVHAAGALDDGVVGSLTPDRVRAVFAPKVDAAWYLHELTRHLDLAGFWLFSSAAGVFGGAGQGNYAASNAFLDALARYRRQHGLPGQSLAWGLWQRASGMTAQLDRTDHIRMARHGTVPLSEDDGLALFESALRSDHATVVPVRLNLTPLHGRTEFSPTLLRDLVPRRRPTARDAGTPDTSLPAQLARLPAAEQRSRLLALIRREAAAVLGHSDTARIGDTQAFTELGFDSLTAIELRNRLIGTTGIRLPATLVFDHPSPAALANLLRTEILGATPEPEAATVTTAAAGEPVAVIGMACRFPGGVASPEDLWRLVADEVDAISGFPDDRGWDTESLYDPEGERPGSSYIREGGFLYDAGGFDAEFFGISPREALATDPQQRLLLETSWELFESAGIDPITLRGSQTAVFAGHMHHDYGSRVEEVPADLEGYLGNGSAGSVVSGRVSYTFGFEGPAVTVDTACSSSLVALHLACQSLRSGESTLALAGGVAVMFTPELFVEFSRQRGLARNGRCKSFADAADGTVWSEGVGLLLLERLSDARRNGHRVLAVVRGSAVNQDGASNGLTAPSGPAQQRVIRNALAAAGLEASDVDVVEAHGTGTALGDPIEAQAILATYGQDRERPLWLGSLKSNIGHTQAAAGVAGVIKMILAMRHERLPKTLHVDHPSSHVDWASGSVELLTASRRWERNGRSRRAGISSFGVSGTNAHVIVEEPEAQTTDRRPEAEKIDEKSGGELAGPAVWVLSARDKDAMRGQAGRLLEHLDSHPDLSVRDIARSLATRPLLARRAVLVGTGRAELRSGLAAFVSGEPAPSVVADNVTLSDGKSVFVFPGQGSQWVGMAVKLLGESPVFAERLMECSTALRLFVDWDVVEVLRGQADAPSLDRVDVVQPVLWAVMVSLAAVWESFGVVPDVVVGHSQGEIAAACVAGGLSLEDGARIVALRGRALAGLSGRGGMVSVALPVGEARDRLARWGTGASIAVVNGARSVVISGDRGVLDRVVADCESRQIRVRRIDVDLPGHSPYVDEIGEGLTQLLAGVQPQSGRVPMLSTVTGEWIDTAELDAGYWFRNLRETVLFEPATRRLLGEGFEAFVEISPHPVLVSAVEETAEGSKNTVVATGTLRRDEGGLDRFLRSVAALHVSGVAVDWSPIYSGARAVELPTYAFQHQHYWLPAKPRKTSDVTLLPVPDQSKLVERLAGLASPDQQAVLHDLVRAEVAAVLGWSEPGALTPIRPFSELGFDSLTAIELRNRLNVATGLRLPTTLVFDEPNLTAVVRRIHSDLGKADTLRSAADLVAELEALSAEGADGNSDLAARLRSISSRWDHGDQDNGIDIESATDEELFELMDHDRPA
ncbi:type I polyketide synthase [Nocardia sp. NPDC051570]|uniref:type I polyketide synthase n=1 Tax=Nocardia sp. NPDC051570 TaxID=3364324 RepID=UPI0037BAA39C